MLRMRKERHKRDVMDMRKRRGGVFASTCFKACFHFLPRERKCKRKEKEGEVAKEGGKEFEGEKNSKKGEDEGKLEKKQDFKRGETEEERKEQRMTTSEESIVVKTM